MNRWQQWQQYRADLKIVREGSDRNGEVGLVRMESWFVQGFGDPPDGKHRAYIKRYIASKRRLDAYRETHRFAR